MISFSKINEWLEQEKQLGSTDPDYAVLATASKEGIPSSRIIHIREINERGLLFFSQQITKKVADLSENPYASMTLWLPLQQKQIVLDGHTERLTNEENKYYWESIPRERQLRFLVNSLKSAKSHPSLNELEEQYNFFSNKFLGKEIPLNDFYCGFCFVPKTLYFYTSIPNGFPKIEFYS